MLRALRQRGWAVVGNERTVQSTVFASTVNGLPVFVGQLDALKPLAQFDLIVLFQVLEHLPDLPSVSAQRF
jgi:2-polyprenyl-3-methyl-5-hydroxy-6-metoxy-1,4-benzoquinol methylase